MWVPCDVPILEAFLTTTHFVLGNDHSCGRPAIGWWLDARGIAATAHWTVSCRQHRVHNRGTSSRPNSLKLKVLVQIAMEISRAILVILCLNIHLAFNYRFLRQIFTEKDSRTSKSHKWIILFWIQPNIANLRNESPPKYCNLQNMFVKKKGKYLILFLEQKMEII